jgi:hypothetical protein
MAGWWRKAGRCGNLRSGFAFLDVTWLGLWGRSASMPARVILFPSPLNN